MTIGRRLQRVQRSLSTSTIHDAGALAVGTASYSIPGSNVMYVSPGGSDANSGTISSPKRTVKAAAAAATSGTTIVLRAGTYYEGTTVEDGLGNGVRISQPNVTIQNYPGEAAWLDGSEVVTGWTSYDGNKWRAPFIWSLDRAPTQVRGEQVSSWGAFLMATYPIAHWPEAVFVNGVPLQQVQTLAEVGPGKFFVEGAYPNATGTMRNIFQSNAYVMGDNPAGKEVRIAKLTRAVGTTSAATNATIRGIGVRRYAVTMPDWGCFYISSDSFKLENVAFQDISDYAVHHTGDALLIRHCDFHRIGRKGIGTTYGDNAVIEWCDFWQTNIRRFNYGPDGGAIKVVRSWDVMVRFNRFRDNRGHGVWYDESCYRGAIHGNWYSDNYGTAALVEISADQLIVDNIFIDNGILSTDVPSNRQPHHNPPVRISSSSRIKVWHNTFINPERALGCGEGWRKPDDPEAFGHDPRQPSSFYDTVMTWSTEDISVANNVFAGCAGLSSIQSSFFSFFDESNIKGTEDFGFTPRKNLYAKLSSTQPSRFANGWIRGGGTSVYFTLTGAPSGVDVPWATLTGDTSTLVTADVTVDSSKGRLLMSSMTAITPQAVSTDVNTLLAQTPFVPQRLGAGYVE